MKEPLLKDRSDEPKPTADRFELPSWWPASTDRGPNRSWFITITIPFFFGAILFPASGEWFWGLVSLAAGIAIVVSYRKLAATERLLDEVERTLELDEPAADDADEDLNR